jgi:hypothetical protein
MKEEGQTRKGGSGSRRAGVWEWSGSERSDVEERGKGERRGGREEGGGRGEEGEGGGRRRREEGGGGRGLWVRERRDGCGDGVKFKVAI